MIRIMDVSAYKYEIMFSAIIIVIVSILRLFLNFILDYRVVIVLLVIGWYTGYIESVKMKLKDGWKSLLPQFIFPPFVSKDKSK